MRRPSASLVVDASVLIAAVIGQSAAAVEDASRSRNLATTTRVIEEARRRIERGLKRPELIPVLDELASAVSVVSLEALAPLLPAGEKTLRDAVPSRNGSTRDAHVLALAWNIGGDIWSADRDFAGTGVASWSTTNLMRALAPAS